MNKDFLKFGLQTLPILERGLKKEGERTKVKNYHHNLVLLLTALVLAAFANTVSAQVLPQVCTLRGTLGTAPPFGATGTLPNAVTRPGSPTATCSGVTPPNPFNSGAGSFRYNVHYLKNPTIFPICVPVRLTKTNPSLSGADLQVSVFQAPFTATDITNSARFRGDSGTGTGANALHQPTTFNVVVPGNSSVALVVYNTVNGSTAAEPYQLDFCTTTTSYTGSAVFIPDDTPAGVNVNLPVSTFGRISDINFRFNTGAGACDATPGNTNAAVSHTFVGDLTFRLTAPGGSLSATFMERRGGTRENICTMLIDDDGGFPELSTITSQSGLFLSGNFASEFVGVQSYRSLTRFDGVNPQGNWTLNVSDNAGGDNGFLRRFSLDITTYPQKAPFDYDGDGRTDISIYRPSPGEWWYYRSSDGGNNAFQFGTSSDKTVPGDYTGDGITDIAFWRPSTGEWFVLRSEDFSFFSVPFGLNGDIPVPADYDGDSWTDIAVYRPSTNTWYISKSSGGTDIVNWGAAGDKPVPADYDGDGKADIAIYRPNGAFGSSEWWYRRTKFGTTGYVQWGVATDKPVPGDYDGDGDDEIAVWRPSTGVWYIFGVGFFPFGTNGDIPTPGDYDGDGKIDAAVYRPSNRTWYVQRSTSGTLIQQFGATGDFPTPNSYVP
jgi:hypothetical protein